MSITYTGSINTKPSTLRDANYDPTTQALFVVESTTPTVRKYNLSTLAFIASATCLVNPSGITLVNSASSVIVSSSATTVDFIENATLYRTNTTGGATTFASRSQQIAGDTTNGIAFAVGGAGKVTKITSSGTVTSTSISVIGGTSGFTPHCVILKSTGRWLVAGSHSKVYEIDTSANVVDQLTVTLTPNTGINDSVALAEPTICSLSYDNNLLLVTTEDTLFLYDYVTKTKLWQQPINAQGSTDQLLLCASASGECLLSRDLTTTTENNTIQEIDFTVAPVQVRDNLFAGASNPIVSLGLINGTNIGYALQQTAESILVMNVTPRFTTTRTVSVQLNGVDQACRLIWIDDTNGTGNTQRILDTYMQSPATYRIPTGKTIIEIVKVEVGTGAQWGFGRFTT